MILLQNGMTFPILRMVITQQLSGAALSPTYHSRAKVEHHVIIDEMIEQQKMSEMSLKELESYLC